MVGSELIHAIGMTLIHFVWQGLLLGLVYGLGRFMLRQASANARYGWALALFIALALTPLITFHGLSQQLPAESASVAASHGNAMMLGETGTTATPRQDGFQLAHLLPWVVAAWMMGVLLYSARLLFGWHHIHRMRRNARPILPDWQPEMLERMAAQFGIWQGVRLAASDYAPGPLLLGTVRPMIIVPTALAWGLSRDQVEMVLAHELAHLRRMDHWVNLFQTTVETLLFFHPVVRWVSKDLRVEREIACDAMAAEYSGDPAAYAETLLQLEQSRADRLPLAIAMADQQVSGRIRRLLHPGRRQGGAIAVNLAAFILVFSGITFTLHDSTPEQDQYAESSEAADRTETSPSEKQLRESDGRETQPSLDDGDEEDSEETGTDTDTDTDTLGNLSEQASDIETAPQSSEASEPSGDQALTTEESAQREDPSSDQQSLDQQSLDQQSLDRPSMEETTSVENTFDTEDVSVDDLAPDHDSADAQSAEVETDEDRGQAAAQESISEAPSDTPMEAAIDSSAAEGLNLAEASMDRSLPELPSESEPEPEAGDQSQSQSDQELEGGELRHQVPPEYPSRARRSQSTGEVELAFTVDTEGRVRDVKILNETPANHDLGRAAREAVKQWRFKPFTRNGMPVEHQVQTGFEFNDPSSCSPGTGTRLPRC